jgi:tetratricopeptide (TPR) repeat protein
MDQTGEYKIGEICLGNLLDPEYKCEPENPFQKTLQLFDEEELIITRPREMVNEDGSSLAMAYGLEQNGDLNEALCTRQQLVDNDGSLTESASCFRNGRTTLRVRDPVIGSDRRIFWDLMGEEYRRRRAKELLGGDTVDNRIATFTELVDHDPSNGRSEMELEVSLELKNDDGEFIRVYQYLADRHPRVRWLQDQLSFALARNGHIEKAIQVWVPLIEQDPSETHTQKRLTSLLRETDITCAIHVWTALLEKHPYSKSLQRRLGDIYACIRDPKERIAALLTLIGRYPDNRLLWEVVANNCEGVNPDYIIGGWGEQLLRVPGDIEIQDKLVEALKLNVDVSQEIAIWKELVERNPSTVGLKDKLAAAYERKGDLNETIEGWKSLVIRYPSACLLQALLEKAYKRKGDRHESMAGWKALVERYPYEAGLQGQLVRARKLKEGCEISS